MIEGIIAAALENSLDTLKPRFGLRSHALPTEEDLDACICGIERVLTARGLSATHVILGSSRSASRVPPNFVVLPCDDAAAEATRIRSDVPARDGQLHLLYFNSDSTPGEAGLSELDELSAADLALAYARIENLPLLQALASSSARVVRARVQDAGVLDLAKYAEISRVKSEQFAAPLLGFLVNPQSGTGAAPRAAAAFDALSGPRALEAFSSARSALEAVDGASREAVAQTLRDRFGMTGEDPVSDVAKLADAVADYAKGRQPEVERLCGLTAELASVLRSGSAVVQRLEGAEPPEVTPQPTAQGATLTDAELLTMPDGAALLASKLDLDPDEDQTLPRMSVWKYAEEVALRPSGRASLLAAAEQAAGPAFWRRGGTLLAKKDVELFGDQLASLPRAAFEEWCWFEKAATVLPASLRDPMETFLARRVELIEMTAECVCGDREAMAAAVAALEHYPLLVVAQLPDSTSRYIEGYESLLLAAAEIRPLPQAMTAWLANLDLALSVDDSRIVRSACLLPLHPLRLAQARLWLEQGKEPPAVPMTLGVYYQQGQPLSAVGRDSAYTVISKGSPGDRGLAEATREGLDAVWTVLRAKELATAIQVELIDVPRPAVVINELTSRATALLDEDADAPGIHIDVRVSYSGPTYEREIRPPLVSELSAETLDALSARRGDGVSLAIASAPVRSGQPCDLAIEAVDAPFVRLPDAGMGITLPDTHLVYRPGGAGNIALIEIEGFQPLTNYHGLLREQLQLSFEARGLSPLTDGPRGDAALVRASVARSGWPLPPKTAHSVLSRQVVDDHIVVTTLASDVFAALVPGALRRVSTAAPDLDAEKIVKGTLSLHSCRTFMRSALERSPDLRDLRGKLGKLRAYEASRQKPAVARLVLDLDAGEGLRWIQTVTAALNLDNKKRCDLLFIDADLDKQRVLSICAVELKAGESRGDLSEGALKALAHQAQLTASRLRATFAQSDTPDARIAREALRRMYWMGAGEQLLALEWRSVLADLDQRLWTRDAPPIEVQCWIVPESARKGDPSVHRNLRALTPNGEVLDHDELVEFHFLAPIAPSPIPPSPPPRSGEPPRRPATPIAASAERVGAAEDASRPPAAALTAGPTPAPSGGAGGVSFTPSEPGSRGGTVPAALGAGAALEAGAPSPGTKPERSAGAPAALAAPHDDGMRVVFGWVDGEQAVWLPNRTDRVNHFNVGITGTMGTGKTQFTKSLLAQLLSESGTNVDGRRPGVLIFDYKGDYIDTPRDKYATTLGLTVLRPEGLPINPLRLVRPTTRQEYVGLPRMFADTLRTIDSRMGNVQRNEVVQAVQKCYEAAGITEERSTWDKPFPTVRDLYAHMKSSGLGAGTPQSIVQDLADFGVFSDDDPDDDLDAFFDGSHVIDLRSLSGTPTLIRAILCFFMNAFYDRMVQCGEAPLETRGERTLRQLRRIILVDEADDFISLNLHKLILTMQQGRSFGHGVFLSTQFLHHFNQNETPLRPLIGTWILHQMADLNPPDVRALFGISARTELSERVQELSTLPQHTSLCLGLSNEGLRGLQRMRDLPYKDLGTLKR